MTETMAKYKRDIPDKRGAILAAACELFAERGFHGTTVPEVAERAHVGAGTVYRYFESKEALVNALYQEWKTEFGRALMKDFDHQASPRRQFHDMWQRMAQFATRYPKVVAFLELHHHAPYLDKASRESEEKVRAPLEAFIEDMQRRDIIKRIPPDMVMAIVYGAFVGIAKAAQTGHLEWCAETLETAESCAWEAIRM